MRAQALVSAARLVHPFPSALDSAATAGIAVLAGAPLDIAARLALAMLLIQFSIGASNDGLDRDVDAARPAKAVASGLVPAAVAFGLAALLAVGGLVVAASVGAPAAALAALGLGVGLTYNVWLNRTAWGWVAFAAGVGLLPVFALWGASDCVRPAYLAIFALALVGGASLALANAVADLEEDGAVGAVTVATRLGRDRAVKATVLTLIAVDVIAAASAVLAAGAPITVSTALAFAAGVAISWTGVAMTALLRPAKGGWEVQAVGLVVTGLAWLSVLNAAGAFARC